MTPLLCNSSPISQNGGVAVLCPVAVLGTFPYILSRVRVSVRPSIFVICKKLSKPWGNLAASASVYFKGQRPAIVTSGAGRHGWLASNRNTATAVCMCVGCAGVRAGAYARVCVRAPVRACMREVFAIYDNTI